MRGNMIFQSVAKRVFGTRYERMKKILVIWPVVFWGLYTADFRIEVAPRIFYLMVRVFTAGREASGSEDKVWYGGI